MSELVKFVRTKSRSVRIDGDFRGDVVFEVEDLVELPASSLYGSDRKTCNDRQPRGRSCTPLGRFRVPKMSMAKTEPEDGDADVPCLVGWDLQ